MSNERTQKLLALLLLLLAGLAVYRPSLNCGFNYDDILVIRDNDFISHPANLLRLWGRAYLRAAGEETYRPLVTASYLVDHLFWGKEPFGYALTNLLLGVFSAWLLFLLLRRLFPDGKAAAGLAAGLYLLHPALVETIAVPSNREQILSVFLLLLAGCCWTAGLDERPRRARWLSPFFLLAACYTLEWGVLWPAVLTGLAFVRGDGWRQAWRRTWPEWLVAWLYLFLWVFAHPRQPADTAWLGGGPAGGLWAFGVLFWRYVRLAFLPIALRPSYLLHAPVALAGWAAQIGLWLVVLGAAIGLLKRKRAALGAGIFLLALLPVSHIFMPFWIVMAERYLALPLIGLLPLVAAGVWRLPKTARWAVAALLILSFGWLAHAQVGVWRDPLSLWSRAVALEPDDPIGWTNYGAALAQRGDYAAAAEAQRQAWEAGARSGKKTAGLALNYARGLAKTGRAAEACRVLLDSQPSIEVNRDWLLAAGQYCARSDKTASSRAFATLLLTGRSDCEAWSLFCATAEKETESCLQQAFLMCPEDGTLWLQVAGIHAGQGNDLKCLQALAMAQRDPRAGQWRAVSLQILLTLKEKLRLATP
ncbi:MAG: hypothetical protein GX444_04235 [Myxococcales bacterium]|nr:hypothetical protein [Myxococcales bacterium]